MPVVTQTEDVRILSAPTEEQIRAVLNQDPVWSAYAIADLHPDHAPYCSWRIAENRTSNALILLYTRLDMPILFAMGEPDALSLMLQNTAMPESVYVTLQEEHYRVAGRFYDFSVERCPMYRMKLTDPAAVNTGKPLAPDYHLALLKAGDNDRIRQLHNIGGPYAPDMFGLYQLESDAFYGIEDENGKLLATGGTHIVDWSAGVGTVGVMYTHPERRGRGLGAALLQAVVAKLIAGGVNNIVLNVDQRNVAARRLYERHGFEIYCPYLEGIGYRK